MMVVMGSRHKLYGCESNHNHSACRDFHSGVPGRGIDTCAALLDSQRRTGTLIKSVYEMRRIPLFIADLISREYFDREPAPSVQPASRLLTWRPAISLFFPKIATL